MCALCYVVCISNYNCISSSTTALPCQAQLLKYSTHRNILKLKSELEIYMYMYLCKQCSRCFNPSLRTKITMVTGRGLKGKLLFFGCDNGNDDEE